MMSIHEYMEYRGGPVAVNRLLSCHFNQVDSILQRDSYKKTTRTHECIPRFISASTPCIPPSPAPPSGIKGWLLGHAGFMSWDPMAKQSATFLLFQRRGEWYKECNSKTILVNLAGNQMVFCSDPEIYKEILMDKNAYFTNSEAFRDVFGRLFPKAMAVLEGEEWKRVRRVSQKALNRIDLDVVVKDSVDVIEKGSKYNIFGNGKDVNALKVLSYVAFDVFHKFVYMFDPETVTGDPTNPHTKLMTACESILQDIRLRIFLRKLDFIWKLPLRRNFQVKRDRDYLVNMGQKLAAIRRAEMEKEKDSLGDTSRSFIDALLHSQEEDILSNEEVSDQLGSLFFGAYETTSNSLLLMLNSLAEKQDVQEKLRREILKHFPNGKADIAKAKLADLDAIQYLMWTLDEASRLNSVIEVFPRDCTKEVVLGNKYVLKPGMAVLIDHRFVGRNPDYYQGQTDLDEFDPDRYEKYPVSDKSLNLPFGYGARVCPGKNIANAELKAILAILITEYQVLPPSDPSKHLILDSALGITCAQGTGYLRFVEINKK